MRQQCISVACVVDDEIEITEVGLGGVGRESCDAGTGEDRLQLADDELRKGVILGGEIAPCRCVHKGFAAHLTRLLKRSGREGRFGYGGACLGR